MLGCYGRLIDAVVRTPGLVPRGRQWYVEQNKRRSADRTNERLAEDEKHWDSESTRGASPIMRSSGSSKRHQEFRVEDFWLRDVFSCKYDGRPDFCSTCYNWKPDRSHHCSELNRCVLKMDHFCPWVGGVVGETSFKFFVQFTFWATLFCLHTLISLAYFMARRHQDQRTIDVHWAVVVGLAGLFFLFSGGMCLSSTQFAFINSTTIENITRKSRIWYFAIYIPDHMLPTLQQTDTEEVRFITYPRPPNEQLQALQQDNADSGLSADVGASSHNPAPAEIPNDVPRRTFGIFSTHAGENPWDIGASSNFADIMGHHVWDWLLPIRRSPCTIHTSAEAFYKVGSVVDRLRQEAGLVTGASVEKRSTGSRHKKHRKRRGHSRPRRRTNT